MILADRTITTGAALKTVHPPFATLLGLVFILPMVASGFLFQTYDIAMPTLPMEMARQFNALFLVAEVAVVGWAAARGMRMGQVYDLLDRPARIALAVFLATFWIGGAFISRASGFATLYNLTFPLHLLFGAAVLTLAERSLPAGRSPALVARVASIGIAVFAVMTAIRFAYPPAGRPLETIVWQFAIPGFISVRLFGACVAPFAALAAWLALSCGERAAYRRWTFTALALSFGVVFWTATRAAILALEIVGVVAMIRYKPRPSRRVLSYAIMSAILGAAVAVLLIPYGDPVFMLFAPGDLESANTATGGRLTFWNAVWTAYQTVPLFGAGPGATSWILGPDQFPHIQPHNLVLQFLVTWGVFATSAALYLIVRVVLAAHRKAHAFRQAIGWVLFADTLLVIGLFDGTFHFAQPLMMWIGSMAMVFASGRAPRRP